MENLIAVITFGCLTALSYDIYDTATFIAGCRKKFLKNNNESMLFGYICIFLAEVFGWIVLLNFFLGLMV